MQGWIGVDLDGCLAIYDGWKGENHIGEPVPAMLERVKAWVAEGKDVRIFTARVHNGESSVITLIEQWCLQHLGLVLPITCRKDYGMICLYDDRCVQVERNTGRLIGAEEDVFALPKSS